VKAGKHPLYIKVVKGMLPKSKLGAKQLGNLYVFNTAEHPYESMNPKVIDINKLK
jgi:large subunit ribosomal protein L13